MGIDGEAVSKLLAMFPVDTPALLCLGGLSTPHLLYLFVWTQSAAFIRLSKPTGIPAFNLFYKLSVLLKFVQLAALIVWGAAVLPPFDFITVTPLRVILAIVFVAAGQALNVGVYNAIGKEGTYYGIKLGKRIDWYEGFPFTVVRDPQYVGCVLSIAGVVAFLYTPGNIEAGLLTVAAGWSSFYFLTGLVENYL